METVWGPFAKYVGFTNAQAPECSSRSRDMVIFHDLELPFKEENTSYHILSNSFLLGNGFVSEHVFLCLIIRRGYCEALTPKETETQ